MKELPSIPPVADAPPELFDGGHLWLVEKIDGAPLRFQLQESGLVRFAERTRVYDDPGEVPLPYQHAVRHVREHLDREALRAAVSDVESVVFFGEATHYHTIDYDWERLPSFLGFDVWSADAGEFRPPDAAEGIFEQLGLKAVNAIERELPVRDFDPDSYTIPESRWYDGPAEGVGIRNKRGHRATLLHPDAGEPDERGPIDSSPEELAREHATSERFGRLAAALDERDQPVTAEALAERALEEFVRERYDRLRQNGWLSEMDPFGSECAVLARSFLDDRESDAW
jgi:hypothetical protein